MAKFSGITFQTVNSGKLMILTDIVFENVNYKYNSNLDFTHYICQQGPSVTQQYPFITFICTNVSLSIWEGSIDFP